MRTFVIGDIHGRYNALLNVLMISGFDMENDRLITLGDICDGGRQTKQCYDLLLKVKNRIDIIGNHDLWFLDWILHGTKEPIWTEQGGHATMESYGFKRENVPKEHTDLIKNSLVYMLDNKNRIYVHGGFKPGVPIENQDMLLIVWDRSLIEYARGYKQAGKSIEGRPIPNYTHVFVGHTSTQIYGGTEPIRFNNLTMMDCGGGWNGRLAMVDVDTHKYYVSNLQKRPKDEEPPDTEEMAWGVDLKNPFW